MGQPEPLERFEFESAALVADFPPVLRDRNKQVVYSICCPEGCAQEKAFFKESDTTAKPEVVKMEACPN